MLFKKKDDQDQVKTCPRCGTKVLSVTDECPDCGLVFSRLDIATNKEAKAKKRRHDRDYIINTKKLPSDVSFVKLLLLAIFTGAFGGHCFYVGRYLRGSILLSDMVAVILCVVFNEYLAGVDGGALIASISTVLGLIEFLWFWDIFAIITKRFKVPVAIDIEGDILKQKQEYMESLNELKEVEKTDDNTQDGDEK